MLLIKIKQMYKIKNNVFYFFLFLNCFISLYTSEIEKQFFPLELQKIIFCRVHYEEKSNLALTCKSFLGIAQEFLKEQCSFNDFVDKLYSIPNNSKNFLALCNNCQNEHKNILTTYFFYKGKRREIIQVKEKNSFFVNNLDKNEIIKSCYNNQQFDNLFKHLVNNSQQDIKYYSDYYNALCCVKLLNRNDDNTSKEIFWFDGKSLDELRKCYKNIERDISDIQSFCNKYKFSESSNNDFEKKLIEDALKSKKISILVWLSEWLKKKYQDATQNKLATIFIAAETHELRKLLAKSGYRCNLGRLLAEEVTNQNYDKVKCYLEIMVEQRFYEKWYINIKNILKFESDDILSDLFKVVAIDDIKTQIANLTADEIKRYVKVGYEQYGASFWDHEGSDEFLHRAVKLNDVKLVKYLLSIGVSNKKDFNYMYFIFYFLDKDDDIFNMLLADKKIILDEKYKNEISSQQVQLLLKKIYELYMFYTFEKEMSEEEKTKITCLLNVLPLNKVDIFDHTKNTLIRMLLELLEEKTTIEYVAARDKIDKIEYVQWKELLKEAIMQNKEKIVRYLFDFGKINLCDVGLYKSNDDNMQKILEEYQQKNKQRQEKNKKVDDNITIINNNQMADVSPGNAPNGFEKGGIFSLSDAEYKITQAIIFLAEELQKNPEDGWLKERIEGINTVWLDNIYARCSNGKCVIPALQALAKINPNLKQLTNEEQQSRAELSKILNGGQGFDINQCDVYLEQIKKIYYRKRVDYALKKDMLFALMQQIKQYFNAKYEFKGIYVTQKNIVINNVNQFLSCYQSSEESVLAFLNHLDTVERVYMLEQEYNELYKVNQAQEKSWYMKYKEVKQDVMSKIITIQKSVGAKVVTNNQNENKSFISFDIIKNVFASIRSAFYSIVCFFNPLRFIW